jgi:hypothetical protein
MAKMELPPVKVAEKVIAKMELPLVKVAGKVVAMLAMVLQLMHQLRLAVVYLMDIPRRNPAR